MTLLPEGLHIGTVVDDPLPSHSNPHGARYRVLFGDDRIRIVFSKEPLTRNKQYTFEVSHITVESFRRIT